MRPLFIQGRYEVLHAERTINENGIRNAFKYQNKAAMEAMICVDVATLQSLLNFSNPTQSDNWPNHVIHGDLSGERAREIILLESVAVSSWRNDHINEFVVLSSMILSDII